ncbi:hypothetical protein VTK73DRAFT_3415 [Phialemonium thermophilum]|uniref:Uncharacterized protein n=1 Tax=Phialemonium thermophilum TaxID=223376 RepID=A0ABR3VIQ8_9PEZI
MQDPDSGGGHADAAAAARDQEHKKWSALSLVGSTSTGLSPRTPCRRKSCRPSLRPSNSMGMMNGIVDGKKKKKRKKKKKVKGSVWCCEPCVCRRQLGHVGSFRVRQWPAERVVPLLQEAWRPTCEDVVPGRVHVHAAEAESARARESAAQQSREVTRRGSRDAPPATYPALLHLTRTRHTPRGLDHARGPTPSIPSGC